MDITGQIDLRELIDDEPMILSIVQWLRVNGCEPSTIIAEALRKLRIRGAFLDRYRRVRYTRKTVLGAFFVIWAKKHHGKRAQLNEEGRELLTDEELKEFERALTVLGDEAAFKRVMPRMLRQRTSSRTKGIDLGNAEEYTSFVLQKSADIADIFLENFETDRVKPERAAVGYIETVSVSRYLLKSSREGRNQSKLLAYLTGRNRMDERTRLAAKLVELPALLTFAETEILRNKYGLTGSFSTRRKVKEVAEQLGFPSPAVLSGRLYKVRKWAEKWTPPPSPPLVLQTKGRPF